MIELDPTTPLTRYFVWCCDNLPLTTGYDPPEQPGQPMTKRKAALYVEKGTNLCHLFWATCWVPLGYAALAGLFIFLFVALHLAAYKDMGESLGMAAFFVPEFIAIGMVLGLAIIIASIFAASKTNIFKLLWTYLVNVKKRICPIVQFAHMGQ